MARKTIDNVRIQQWGLTLDNWDLAPDTVAVNELAVINDSSDKTIALYIGDGVKSPTEYYNDADDNSTNIFFPGIGAGYRLPVAKTNLLGGIKINSAYFSITDDGKFSPTFISYGSGVGENGGPILELPNKHNLTVYGTLTAENVVSEEKYQIQVTGEYIDVHKRTQMKSKTYFSIEPEEGVIKLPDYYDSRPRHTKIAVCIISEMGEEKYWVEVDGNGEVWPVPEGEFGKILQYYHVLEENDSPPYASNIISYKNFDKLIANNQSYLVVVNEYNSDPFILEDGEYSGIRMYNYSKNDKELPEEEREVAELSVDNNGTLWYSKNGLGLNEPTVRNQVALITGYNGLAYIDDSGNLITTPKITLEQMPDLHNFTIGVGEKIVTYNPLTNDSILSIDQNYCKAIIANGQRYDMDENLVIDLGSPVWTEEMANKLNSAVQSVTFNGEKQTGNDLDFTYTINVTGSSLDLISSTKSGGSFTIKHTQPGDYNESAGLSSNSVNITNTTPSTYVISSITRDSRNFGHIVDYQLTKIDFSNLLSRVTTLESQLSTANSKIATLESNVESLLRRVEDLEARI